MRGRLFTVIYMVVISALATAGLTGAKLLLAERISRNETLQERRAQLDALGLLPEGADAQQIDSIFSQRVKEEDRAGRNLLYAYAQDGTTLEAVGFEFKGMGFWGPIRGILALDPNLRYIVGVVFLRHQETPGLGGRMTEPWFRDQFKGKDVAEPDLSGRYLIFLPEGAAATGPREVNAITGATRTSDSLKRIFNESLRDFQAVMRTEEADPSRE